MNLDSYPRPPRDNGRGFHWSPLQQNQGVHDWTIWEKRLLEMKIRWVKILTSPDFNAVQICRRLISIGIMPVVRYYSQMPKILDGSMEQSIADLIRVGVVYFEGSINEPDDPSRGWDGSHPSDWRERTIEAILHEARTIQRLGGIPGLAAFETKHGYPETMPQMFAEAGGAEVMERGAFWSIHNYGKGRAWIDDNGVPHIGWPYLPPRMFETPITPEQYEQPDWPFRSPDAPPVDLDWAWRGQSLDAINRKQADQANSRVSVREDHTCFLFFMRWAWLCEEAGLPTIPVIGTEAGFEHGDVEADFLPRPTAYAAGAYNLAMYRFTQGEPLTLWTPSGDTYQYHCPEWYFASMNWIAGQQAFGEAGPWELGSYFTHAHDAKEGLNGEMPIVQMLRDLPEPDTFRADGPVPPEWNQDTITDTPGLLVGPDIPFLPGPIRAKQLPDDISGWRLWKIDWQDPNDRNWGLTDGYIFVRVSDGAGNWIEAAKIRIEHINHPENSLTILTKGGEDNYLANFQMFDTLGAYRVYVDDDNNPSTVVEGLGLGLEDPRNKWDQGAFLLEFEFEAVSQPDPPPDDDPIPVPIPTPPDPLPALPISPHNHKFCPHINGWSPAVIDAAIRLQSHIVKVLDHNVDNLRILRDQIPGVFIIGRLVADPQPLGASLAEAAQLGRDFAERLLRLEAVQLGLINGLESYNEVVGNQDGEFVHRQYDAFQVAFGEKIKAEAGIHPIALNFGTGNGFPDIPIEWYAGTFEICKYLGFHEYDWPTMSRLHRQGIATGNGGMWLALRYKRLFNALKPIYGNRHKAIITECGMTQGVVGGDDIGWLATQNTTQLTGIETPIGLDSYFQTMMWYSSELMKDDDVLGACLFVTGASGGWKTFENLGPFMKLLEEYQQSDQDEPPPVVEPPVVELPLPPEDDTMPWHQKFNELAIDHYNRTGQPLDDVSPKVNDLQAHLPDWEFTVPEVFPVLPFQLEVGQYYLRCIGLHLLTADENRGNQHAYFDVLDPDGKRITGTKLPWGWKGMSVDERNSTPPILIDKPDNEPGGNVGMNWNMTLIVPNTDGVLIPGYGTLNHDVVRGVNVRLPNDPTSDSDGNKQAHWSTYVVFQVRQWTGEVEPDDPPPTGGQVLIIEDGYLMTALEISVEDIIAALEKEGYTVNDPV